MLSEAVLIILPSCIKLVLCFFTRNQNTKPDTFLTKSLCTTTPKVLIYAKTSRIKMLPNSNFFLNLLRAILVPLKPVRFFPGNKYGHNFTQSWHEAERMELNRCSVKQLGEAKKANLLYIFQ